MGILSRRARDLWQARSGGRAWTRTRRREFLDGMHGYPWTVAYEQLSIRIASISEHDRVAAAATGIRHDSAGEELWRLRKNFADDALSLVVWLAFAWAVYTWTFPLTAPTFPVPYLLFILYFTRLQFRLLMVPVWAANTLNLLSERRKIPSTNGLGAPPFLVFIAAYKAQGSIGSVLEALKHQDYPEDRFEVYVVTQARISILALARPQYTPAPLRTARPFTLNPAHHLCW